MKKKIKKQNKKVKLPNLFGIGKEKEYLAENISSLVSAGVGIAEAIRSVSLDIKNKGLNIVLDFVVEEIENGSSVWRAFEKSKLFKEHTIALLKIGEETGKLGENLKTISKQERKSREFKSKIKSAAMYPIFVLGLTLIVGVGIAWFILPKLTNVFESLSVELPKITKVIIAFGNFLQSSGVIAVPIFFLLIIASVYFVFFFKKTKFIGQHILLHIPGIKKLVRKTELSRFGFLFGTLLSAGLSMSKAVNFLSRSTSFRPYQDFYKHIELSILEGNSFRTTFENYEGASKIIPHSIQQVIFSAEQSGRLSDAFSDIGAQAEAEAEYITKNISVILEPILLVIVFLGVAGVAVGVILPIYSLVGGLG